jgi:SanA protein
MKRFLRRTLQLTAAAVLLVLACILYCNWRVESLAKGRTYSDADAIPHRHVGLLLGTSKFGTNGVVNRYYRYRIDAAARLFHGGKIDYIIASGDNSKHWYNEPETMRADLIAAGVDSTRIFLDYAGFRTFDSMIRLREIFSQQQATVISQKFHNERALYIAQREGIDAIGFNAADIRGEASLKTRMRERLARVKVFLDYVIGTKPKFLGPKIDIP